MQTIAADQGADESADDHLGIDLIGPSMKFGKSKKLLFCLALLLQGCAATSGVEPTDLSVIQAGVTVADVEAALGKPIESVDIEYGHIATYSYDLGAEPVASAHALGYAFPLSLFFAPGLIAKSNELTKGQRRQLAVIFDTHNQVRFVLASTQETYGRATLARLLNDYEAFLSGDANAAFKLSEIALVPKQKASLLHEAAKGGVAHAQFEFGSSYEIGAGVARDLAEAVKWWRKAAEQGHAPAYKKIGNAYRFGQSVPRDETEAKFWLTKAADAGDIEARKILYKESEREAIAAAAIAGNRDAQVKLANIYRYGINAPKDLREAARLYELAASAGDDFAAYALGNIYATGDSEFADSTRAYMWYSIAEQLATDDTSDIGRLRSRLTDTMSANQIAEAERMAREWLDAHHR